MSDWIDIGNFKDATVWIDSSTTTPAPLPARRIANRRAFARAIRAVLAIPDWRTETHADGEVLHADIGKLQIVRMTVASGLRGAPAENGIDIWCGRKVFSIWWHDDPDDFEIVAMATGDWFEPLMASR